MLKQLRIQNIVLIESADINFQPGFNVISGETGAGKSAIMGALNLISGVRADSTLVRRGHEKGLIEAIFDIDQIDDIKSLLEESGINHEKGDDFIIRRELSVNGKSRIFVNDQTVQRTLLVRICEKLFNIVGQHANQLLLAVDSHRRILDLYGELHTDLHVFKMLWEKENELRKELNQLVDSEPKRLRDIEVCRMELEELEQANVKEGEEEELFSEYSRLTNSEELSQHTQDIVQALNGEKNSVMASLKRCKTSFTELLRLDPALQDTVQSFETSFVELQEVLYHLQRYEDKIEFDPIAANKMNDRLTFLNKLKRKYGSTIQEIQTYQEQTHSKLQQLENADFRIIELKEMLATLSQKLDAAALALTQKRLETAKALEKAVIEHLRSLNMPKVEFHINISKHDRTSFGDDHIEFYLVPNVGERKVPIRECASGGELSRILLALQTLLAGKEKIATMIFDEIDSNIGGETATIVAKKLQEIGLKHQVLCITHFPQVAKMACHHLQISKHEIEGRTVTFIKTLDHSNREKELARMRGE